MTHEPPAVRPDSALPPVYDVFVGYAGPDHALVERLVNLLHGRISVWWDRFLAPDESFDSAIPEILRSSSPRTHGTANLRQRRTRDSPLHTPGSSRSSHYGSAFR